MGTQIIKQPSGKYCLFSSVVDNVTCYNLGRQDLIDEFMDRERERVTKHVDRVIKQLDDDGAPYHQFTMTYAQMLETIEGIHGKDVAQECRAALEDD